MRLFFGVALIVVGLIAAVYLNIWCLITGIIDIYNSVASHVGSVGWGIFKIVLREFIGAIVIAVCWGFGMGLLTGEIGKVRPSNFLKRNK